MNGVVRGVGVYERDSFKNVAFRWEIKGRGPSKKRRRGRPDQHIVFTKPESAEEREDTIMRSPIKRNRDQQSDIDGRFGDLRKHPRGCCDS